MFNTLLKKRKSNKGFTLIELIVVIAIIAILSLLLVPRFLGFTDRAKVSADTAACKTIEKAVMTLIATDALDYSTSLANSIFVANSSGTWTASNVTPSDVDILKPLVENLIGTGTTHDSQTNTGFTVVISTGGAITVNVGP